MGLSTIKAERINLRLDEAAKQRLERAAAVEGQTVSAFILKSALERAEQALERHDALVLSRRDAEAFLEALAVPPAHTPALEAAVQDYRRRVESR